MYMHVICLQNETYRHRTVLSSIFRFFPVFYRFSFWRLFSLVFSHIHATRNLLNAYWDDIYFTVRSVWSLTCSLLSVKDRNFHIEPVGLHYYFMPSLSLVSAISLLPSDAYKDVRIGRVPWCVVVCNRTFN